MNQLSKPKNEQFSRSARAGRRSLDALAVKAKTSEHAREELAEVLIAMLKKVVAKMERKAWPGHIGPDDLVQEGSAHVMAKLELYYPSRGGFRSWSCQCARNRIRDVLSMHGISKEIVADLRKIDEATLELYGDGGHPVSFDAVCSYLNAHVPEFRNIPWTRARVAAALNARELSSSERLDAPLPSDPTLTGHDRIGEQVHFQELGMVEDVAPLVRESTKDRDWSIFVGVYIHGLTLADVGRAYRLSPSRTSEVARQVLRRIRRELSRCPADLFTPAADIAAIA